MNSYLLFICSCCRLIEYEWWKWSRSRMPKNMIERSIFPAYSSIRRKMSDKHALSSNNNFWIQISISDCMACVSVGRGISTIKPTSILHSVSSFSTVKSSARTSSNTQRIELSNRADPFHSLKYTLFILYTRKLRAHNPLPSSSHWIYEIVLHSPQNRTGTTTSSRVPSVVCRSSFPFAAPCATAHHTK